MNSEPTDVIGLVSNIKDHIRLLTTYTTEVFQTNIFNPPHAENTTNEKKIEIMNSTPDSVVKCKITNPRIDDSFSTMDVLVDT